MNTEKQSPLPPPGFTIAEVAEALRVSKATVYRWISDGRVETLKIGRARRITPQQYERLLADHADARG